MSDIIYDATLEFTNVTSYGADLGAILSGQAPVPPQGARFDVAFAGPTTGEVAGRMTGVDYLNVRADGRVELNIRGCIETASGGRVAMKGVGVGNIRPEGGMADIREHVELHSQGEESWLNGKATWGQGTVDLARGLVRVTVYA